MHGIADITCDNVVGIDDLLLVLNSWGACGAPCPADVVPTGTVNIDDLLFITGNYGVCATLPDGGQEESAAPPPDEEDPKAQLLAMLAYLGVPSEIIEAVEELIYP